MYCLQCGQRLADHAKFCPNCGAVTELPRRDQASGEDDGRDPSLYAEQKYQEPSGEQASRPADERYAASDSYSYSYGAKDAGGSRETRNYWEERPETPRYDYSAQPQKSPRQDGFALAGLILSILSLVLCCQPYLGFPLAVAGIVFSALGLKSQYRHGMAVAGLVIGIISVLINGFLLAAVIVALTDPVLQEQLQEYLSQFSNITGYGVQ